MSSDGSDKSWPWSFREFQDVDDNDMAKDILELTDPNDSLGIRNDWWDHHHYDDSAQQKKTGPTMNSMADNSSNDNDTQKKSTPERNLSSRSQGKNNSLPIEQETRDYIPTVQAVLVEDVETQQTSSGYRRPGSFYPAEGMPQASSSGESALHQHSNPPSYSSPTRRKPAGSSTVATATSSTATTPSSQGTSSSRIDQQLYVDAAGFPLGLSSTINYNDAASNLTETPQNQALQQQEMLEQQQQQKELRRRRMVLFSICITAILVVAAVATVVGVVVPGGDDDDDDSTTPIITPKPFANTSELYDAVDKWISGEFTSDSDLAAMYGYPIGKWDVSAITDFSYLFAACPAGQCTVDPSWSRVPMAANFTDDISEWNVSSAVTMKYMLSYLLLFNGDLSRWDVSNVNDMSSMFYQASSFNGNISNWDVSSVLDMSFMFRSADAFTRDISQWDVSSVTNMSRMFSHTDLFNSDISQWDVSNVRDMSNMFREADLFNGNISQWDVSNVNDMSFMFRLAYSFNQDLSQWNVESVTNMESMFYNASSFNQDMCAWGEHLQTSVKTTDAFLNTACPDPTSPQLDSTGTTVIGPFCYSCAFV